MSKKISTYLKKASPFSITLSIVLSALFVAVAAQAATTIGANISTDGTVTALSVNKVTITAPTTAATLTLVDGSSLITAGAFSNTLTTTAATNATLPAGTNTLYSTLASSITSAALLSSISNETGTGLAVFGTSPTLVTPVLGAATATSVAVGSAGTVVTNIQVYSQTLTPAATGATIGTAEQTFAVAGLTTADKVFVSGPAPTSLCPLVTFRVSALNTLAIGFSTLSALACTPVAGVYNIVAIRN